jgi:two-component system, OmpR family, response regulator
MALTHHNIICVDPDPHTGEWLRMMLEDAKVNASLVSLPTGREAFRRICDEDFDLCVLEYALPDMTGVQLCSLVRQVGWSIPIMFLTAMNRTIDRERAETAGANEYLAKPDDLDRCVESIYALLNGASLAYLKTSSPLTLLPRVAA